MLEHAVLEVYFSPGFKIKYKEDSSPVTNADMESHRILTSGLAKLTPDIPLMSEESEQSTENLHLSDAFWLIDPLDGTKGFIKRNGEFTVNLALIYGSSTRIGFVGRPSKNLVCWGGRGLGAFISPSNTPDDISYLSCHGTVKGINRVITSRTKPNQELSSYIDGLVGQVEITQADSSLKFLEIAEGRADIYPRFSPTYEWDTAAAQAVLEGAGGSVLQVGGEQIYYGKSDLCNPCFIARGINA